MLIGEPWSGKSIIFEFMAKYVYGSSAGILVNDFDPILQRFNSIVEGKMLICVDETDNADHGKFSSDFNKFKPRVTGDNIIIEPYAVPNYVSYAVCSNHEIPLRIEQADRRFAVLQTSSRYIGNNNYFDIISRGCFNQETGDIFYSFLRSDVIEKYLVSITPPQ